MHTPRRIFVTGATGHIGSVVCELAIAQGYIVHGLSRSEKGDIKLRTLGVSPVRGDLQTLDVLSTESKKADIVIHVADSFLDHAKPRQYEEVIHIDAAAINAMGAPLKGTSKPLIVTSGALVVSPDPDGGETTEESPIDPKPFIDRVRWEQNASRLVSEGVKVVIMRLAPFVYGRSGSGVSIFMTLAFSRGQAVYVGDGDYYTSTAHVDDTAKAYLLAAEKAQAGDIFNVVSSTDVTIRQLTEAMAAALNVPAVSITENEAVAKHGEFLSKFLTSQCRASGAKAKRVLGWSPRERSILEEIRIGSYQRMAQTLLMGAVGQLHQPLVGVDARIVQGL